MEPVVYQEKNNTLQPKHDVIAELLKEEIETQNKGKCLIIKYGDYLKFICKEYFEWNGAFVNPSFNIFMCITKLSKSLRLLSGNYNK